MKTLFQTAAISAVLACASDAAVFNVNVSATAAEILNRDGSAFTTGDIRVGTYGSNPIDTSTLSSSLSGFNILGTLSTSFGGFAPSSTVVADDTGNAAPPNNTGQLYLVIGNTDDNFGVFTDTNWELGTFTSPPTPTNSVAVSLDSNTVNVDGRALFIEDGNVTGASGAADAWQLAVIPEPSVALLSMIGAFGLLRRRR